jgi:hypothetical protein
MCASRRDDDDDDPSFFVSCTSNISHHRAFIHTAITLHSWAGNWRERCGLLHSLYRVEISFLPAFPVRLHSCFGVTSIIRLRLTFTIDETKKPSGDLYEHSHSRVHRIKKRERESMVNGGWRVVGCVCNFATFSPRATTRTLKIKSTRQLFSCLMAAVV